MKWPRKTRKIYAAWIAALAYAHTVFIHIVSIGFFRYAAMFTTTLSDWRTLKSSLIAPIFRFHSFIFNCHDLHIIHYIDVHVYMSIFGFMYVTRLIWLYMIRHTRSMLQKWSSSRRGLRIGSSKARLITVLHAIDASKNHLSIAPLAAR